MLDKPQSCFGESSMTIELNHTIVPVHDNDASAHFYRDLFGFEFDGPFGTGPDFQPVAISSEGR